MPDPALPSAMTTFQLLFGRSPRTAFDVFVTQMYDTETSGGLTNLVENRRHNMTGCGGAEDPREQSENQTAP